jgi:hypothetical protein
MPSQSKADLSAGTVLHVKDYSSRGHPPKDKYLILIGCCTENVVLAFLISSQLSYLKQDSHRKEVVRVPHNATDFLPSESIIQCFEMERLSLELLQDGIESGKVSRCGRFPVKYLHLIREAVSASTLLPQKDIDDAMAVLPPSN